MTAEPSSTWTLARLAAAALAAGPLGWASARLARRLAGVASVPSGWMALGVLGLGASVPAATPAALAAGLALGWALLMLLAVDVAALRLPDAITLPLAAAGLWLGAAEVPLGERVAGLAAGFLVIAAVDRAYVALRGRPGVGLGDAKLFGAAGAWLGWRALPAVLLLACGGALAWVALRLLSRGRAAAAEPIPFGAPLCVAIWMLWRFGG